MRQQSGASMQNKIKECEEKINPAPKPAPPAEIARLTIDRKAWNLGVRQRLQKV